MSKSFAAQAAFFAAAALLTLAMVAGNGALAAHEYHAAAIAQAQVQQMAEARQAIEVQHVTIVGHRTARA